MTVHRSKGLEADYVVVLGLCSGKHGFPAEVADDPLLDLVLAAPENHPNAEERRVLYVAMTRARRQVFLLADGGPPSEFVTELMDGDYDVEPFGRSLEADISCPRCVGGRLLRRKNARTGSLFYGCSNFPLCEHIARPCTRCGRGIPLRSGENFHCRDCGGTIKACPPATAGSMSEWAGTADSSAVRTGPTAGRRGTFRCRERQPVPQETCPHPEVADSR